FGVASEPSTNGAEFRWVKLYVERAQANGFARRSNQRRLNLMRRRVLCRYAARLVMRRCGGPVLR
ncbi:hypothetical protein OFB92_30415, partial [Escherichia coli]|nr:hypothetical protein [Escherichia coli]